MRRVTPPRSWGDEVTLDQLDRAHHETMAALRATAPVVWVPALAGWVVTRRAEAVEVMRDPRRFTVDDPRFSTARVVGPSMLSLDGPNHRRHREPFVEALRAAGAVERLTPAVEGAARRLLQRTCGAATIELRGELAGPLAVGVVALALGAPQLDDGELLGWYRAIVASVDTVARGGEPTEAGAAALAGVAEAIAGWLPRPGSPLDVAGRTLTPAEVLSNAAVFLFGGIETSEGMTANAFAHVLGAGWWPRVVAEPQLIDAVIEESLRLEPAAARVDRYATTDTQLAGSAIGSGDLVVVSIAAANRDPLVFDHPDRFDPRRANRHLHLAFAQGPHACLGARLARVEAGAALRAATHVAPGIELVHLGATSGIVFRKPDSVTVRRGS